MSKSLDFMSYRASSWTSVLVMCSTARKGVEGVDGAPRVQRLRQVGDGSISYTVVGGDGLPVESVEVFLRWLTSAGRSPNTVAAYAHDLRDFVEWLAVTGRCFQRMDVDGVAEFFAWLRRPLAARQPDVLLLPGTPARVTNRTVQRKRSTLASFYAFHARRDSAVPAVLGGIDGRRVTGPFVPMLAHTRPPGRLSRGERSPIKVPVVVDPPLVLSDVEVRRLLAACCRWRDRFLLVLLHETGLRLGEALGLRHSDLRLRQGEVHVVPRLDNANRARVKGLRGRVVPVRGVVFDAYATYMEVEYGALDSDYVFVNLFRPPVGAPMRASAVEKLAARLRRDAGVASFSPHVLRHGFATRLLRAGVPIEVVPELLGHSSPQTTAQAYAHLTVEDHRRALYAAGVFEPAGEAL
ncbi:tyrosine-type recombinase/integrase [Dactylosporangium sp. CA-139066]|uniref:tyrosine-type recombinase/integrase n=1 Tax=Dactylosporangium sp. CA-139066 TaxID=3239930 RepID=UPI003D91BC50